MDLWLTQLLTEMSTKNISWVKAAGAYGRQPYNLQVPIVLKSRSLDFLEPSGLVEACNGIALPFSGIRQDSSNTSFTVECKTYNFYMRN